MTETIHFPIPIAERNPDKWVILGSGPNSDGWLDYALEKRANIFCVNGSVILCDNPTCYSATDPEALKLFSRCIERLPKETQKILGVGGIKEICTYYTISGTKVRTMAMWALYIACLIKHPKSIAIFGVYGSENKKWTTLAHLAGNFKTIQDYSEASQEMPLSVVETATMDDISDPDGANYNAAILIKKIRKMFPDINIEIKGGGPVSDLVSKPGLLKGEIEFVHSSYDMSPAPLLPFWTNAIKNRTVKPLREFDFRRYKKGDTVFLLGSGPSVNDLTEKDFKLIEWHDSIGFNMWPAHDFVPTIYECEAPDNETREMLYALWNRRAKDYEDVPFIIFDNMMDIFDFKRMPESFINNMFVAKTHFILGDGKTKESYAKSLREMVSLGFFGYKPFPENISVLSRRRSSGILNLSLALQMGYKRIILVGYDMQNHDYFHSFNELKKPGEKYCSETTNPGIPASSVIQAMVEEVARPMGVKVFIGSEKSVLSPFLPLFDRENKR